MSKLKIILASAAIILSGSAVMAQTPEQQKLIDYQDYMIANHVKAPDFTLKNMDGQDVSLSEFEGYWVVIDFWGSWCGWCIRGIPEMKALYEELHPKGLMIVGVDCGDTIEKWRDSVEKYELPWVNLYNPGNNPQNITADYAVLGFPTKVIVDPSGNIYEIVTGEDPQFYQIVREALAK